MIEDATIVFTKNLKLQDFLQINTKLSEIISKSFEKENIKGFFKSETHLHTSRVSEISAIISKELNLSKNDIYLIQAIAPFHDIGKLGIDTNILNKPGKINKKEFEHVKTHSQKDKHFDPEVSKILLNNFDQII